MMEPAFRLQWDSNISTCQRFDVGSASPNTFIQRTSVDSADGGYVSARDVIELISINEFKNETTGRQSVQVSSKSIEREDIPDEKGVQRDSTMICGALFEQLSDEEMEKMELPKLMVPVKENGMKKTKECGWTRIRYILQTEITGTLPSTEVSIAMSSTCNGMMRDLRNYIIQKRLKLEGVVH